MSKPKVKKTIGKSTALCMLILFMLALCVISLFVLQPFSASAGSTLDNAVKNSEKVVKKFDSESIRTNAKFSDAIFKRASGAALAYTGKDADLQKIAESLSFESVMITNDKSEIVAAYPADLVGKSIKKLEGTKKLNTVAKGIAIKALGEVIQAKDSDSYTAYAAVARQDDAGAVVVSLLADDYADIIGANLAESCGENVIIEKNGAAVSSSFTAAEGKKIADLDKAGNGQKFDITLDGKTYEAKTTTVGDYSVLTAVDKASAGSNNNMKNFIIIAGADIFLLIAGIVIICTAAKPKKDE